MVLIGGANSAVESSEAYLKKCEDPSLRLIQDLRRLLEGKMLSSSQNSVL